MNTTFTRVIWLLKREFLEARLAIFVVPMIIAVLALLMFGFWLFAAVGHSVSLEIDDRVDMLADLTDSGVRHRVAVALGGLLFGFNWVLFGYMAFATGLYCINALYEDRVDRSILFWHSLPVSDGETVLSKTLMAILVIPAIALAVSVCVTVGAVMLFAIRVPNPGESIALFVEGSAKIYSAVPLQLSGAIFSVAWLLFMGSLSRSRPMLWAIFIPFLIYLPFQVTAQMFRMEGLSESVQFVGSLLAFGLFPGAFTLFPGVSQAFEQDGISAALSLLLHSPLYWGGFVTSIALLVGATHVRSRAIEVL